MERPDDVARRFAVAGRVTECRPYGSGHINDTYLVVCQDGGESRRYILQAVNRNVFGQPRQVIANVAAVTAFLREKGAAEREALSLVPARDGGYGCDGADGRVWRMCRFVEGSLCLEKPETAGDFYQCAAAFGRFQRLLADFPAETLYETIPDFHNTPKRFRDLLTAVSEDVCGRAAGAREEIRFLTQRAGFYPALYDAYEAGRLPLRVAHNDTKINNVLLDADTRAALCVIDLDTVMPGFSVTDFGDAIRSGANTAAEDEPDLDRVRLDLTLFDAFADGYLTGCGGMLTEDEILLMPEGAKMMTLECAMRFLTDYLRGDVYFKTACPEHNLIRCRAQLKLAEDMERHWDAMKEIVAGYADAGR